MATRRRALGLAAVVVASGPGCTGDLTAYRDIVDPTLRLVWSDEFSGYGNAPPDASRWSFEVGIGPNGDGWGNGELQYYTARPDNARLDGYGALAIYTLAEDYMGRRYTSARLSSKATFTHQYGRVEARMKLPQGPGLWPAFWMLGANIDQVSWPGCGEIDVMENRGDDPQAIRGSLHGPGYSGAGALTKPYTLPDGAGVADDFHVYAVDWSPAGVRFLVDNLPYQTRLSGDVPLGGRWVFDQPFFLLLNVAVGGNYPGPPDTTSVFPQTTLVDYVRVYDREP